MIHNLDNLIKRSILEKDSNTTRVLRSIKSEILLYQTSKNAKPLDDTIWVSIINKMIKQRNDSKEQYIKGNRLDLAESEENEIKILEKYIPAKATREEIEIVVYNIMKDNNWENNIPKQSMGIVIKKAKERLMNVDSKELADYIKSLCV